MKLKTKFLLAVVVLLIATISLIAGLMVVYERNTLIQETHRERVELVQRLVKVSEESLYQSDIILLNYLKEISKDPAITGACVTNTAGKIIVHSDVAQIGSSFILEPRITPDDRGIVVRETSEKDRVVLTYAQNIYLGSVMSGVAYLFIDKSRSEEHIRSMLRQVMWPLLVISGIVFLLGITGALVVAKTLAEPIETIIGGMRTIAQGTLKPLPVTHRSDELGWMAEELNIMIQKLKELDEMKQEFVASVTHELRSPLTAIDRFASLLLEQHYGPLNAQQRESLITLRNNTVRLKNFINDVLTSAHIETQQLDMYLEQNDGRSVLEEVHALFTPIAIEKNLTFTLSLPPNPALGIFDRLKMTQVITNLVSNAFKFTKHGGVTASVSSENETLQFDVQDTGVGIPANDKEKIFNRFFRSANTAHTHSGTGLGLAIVKGLVELHRGQIVILDRPGGGSIFRVVIPKGS